MLENGWEYRPVGSGTADEVNGFRYHYQLYTTADPGYTGRVTVPVLWDKDNRTIVNNESAEIIRMLSSGFSAYTDVRTDYPNLSNYLRDLYQQPGIAETVRFGHIKRHYYYSHATVNPTRIVPLGPEIDLDAPHDRTRLS